MVTLTLAAAAPLRAAQAVADTAHGQGAHHHKHGGGKHGAGHKWLSFDAATNTVTLKLVAVRPRGTSRLNFNGHKMAKPPSVSRRRAAS